MPKLATIIYSLVFFGTVLSSPVTDGPSVMDQRQSGELNVQVSLKDVHIIALLGGDHESFSDYEYNYDYTDMTIKPQNGSASTTASPVSSAQATASNATASLNKTDDSDKTQSSSSTAGASTSEAPSSEKSSAATEISTAISASAIPGHECRKGYHKNKQGVCEFRTKAATVNTLKKLVELSQKLKLRRANN